MKHDEKLSPDLVIVLGSHQKSGLSRQNVNSMGWQH